MTVEAQVAEQIGFVAAARQRARDRGPSRWWPSYTLTQRQARYRVALDLLEQTWDSWSGDWKLRVLSGSLEYAPWELAGARLMVLYVQLAEVPADGPVEMISASVERGATELAATASSIADTGAGFLEGASKRATLVVVVAGASIGALALVYLVVLARGSSPR